MINSTKKVIIYPEKKVKENKYINNLYDTIKDYYHVRGYNEVNKSIKLFLSDIYHFNWIESAQGKFIKIKYAKKRFFINILKVLNKKIVWTVHNNEPHETVNAEETIKFMKFMARKADRIHVLCNATIEREFLKEYKEKIVYIPSGDYIGNYEESDLNIYERYNIKSDKKIILFIGQIRKYKNIELLINAFINSRLESNGYVLLICGKCNDAVYKKEIMTIGNKNIYFDFDFIKDEEIAAYLKSADILVSPYNKKSALNSGTLWMSMSYKKTMIIPLIGCVKDIKNYKDFLYVYDYKQNEKDSHYNALFNSMINIKKDITKNEDILKEKGEKAYNYIIKNQTWKLWRKEWIELYKF